MRLDPVRGDLAPRESLVADQGTIEWQRGLDPADDDFVERPPHPVDGGSPVRGDRHDLGDHRVVVRRHPLPGANRRIDPNARTRRHLPRPDAAGRRREDARRILRGQPDLDGVTHGAQRSRRGGDHGLGERRTRRDPQLFRDEIQVRDELRHAMLHLEARVHLEEPEPPIRVEQELGGGGVVEVRGPGGLHGEVVQLRPLVRCQARRRRFLDQLLMPALDRAVALPQRDDRAIGIAEQLDFDVACRPHLAFQVDRTVAEGRGRFRRSRGQRSRQLRRCADTTHAATAATRRRLDEQREPDVLGGRDDRRDPIRPFHRDRVECPGDHRHARALRRPARRQFVAQRLDRVRAGSDEREARIDDGPRKRRPLRQEAVARVNGLRPRRVRRLDDRVGTKVAFGGRRRTQPNRAVGGLDMQRVPVGIRVHGDRLDAEVAAGPDDAHRDLTAVGDEDPLEGPATVLAQRHGRRRRSRSRRHSGMLPCFFGGFVSRLSANIASAAISRGLVSEGRMTSSTYPRAAAAYGLAKRSS